MAKPSLQLVAILVYELKYPKQHFFCFEGYNGVEEQYWSVVAHINDYTKKIDVTQLVPGCCNKVPLRKYVSVLL